MTHSSSSPAAARPKGELTKYIFSKSRIFPGTTREYWIYVPQQYDPTAPACVQVSQDGVLFRAPSVFDRLIANGQMPVTIGVFVMPGRLTDDTDPARERNNRSYEYDSLSDDYVRFLLKELLPEVETKRAADGRPIRLSRSGNDRCIVGFSSGGVCAFTAAWRRPDAFSRVFSGCGSFVGMRGGHAYPELVRLVEPKPLRIFLHGGSADLNLCVGDWWLANQEMARSLALAGYDARHVWDEGGA